ATFVGLESSDIDLIIQSRPMASTSALAAPLTGGRVQIGWLAQALGPKAVGMGNLITWRSYQYSAEIIAVSANGRAWRRFRIVIDNSPTNSLPATSSVTLGAASSTTPTPVPGCPQIIYRRDISDRGFPLDLGILDSLRAGNGP